MAGCLAYRAPEHLPVPVGVVLDDPVVWALEGVELEISLPAWAGFLLGGGYLEKLQPKFLDA